MPKPYKGRHRRPTQRLPMAAVARPAMVFAAAGAVSLGMAGPALAHTGDHTVGAGDTLSGLAAEHGTSWRTIYADNRDVIGGNPNALRIGQVLTIGAADSAPSAPSAASGSGEYVVAAGDTLSTIAARHGTSWQALFAANRAVIGGDPNVLRVGQHLALSDAAPAVAPASQAVPEAASRGVERGGEVAAAAPVVAATGAPTPSSTSYSAWAPQVRPVVQEVAAGLGVSTVLTRPGHSPTQELAADFMVYTDSGKGEAVTRYVIDNAARFGVEYVIWEQRIYLVSSGTWQAMEDRGSPTANHMDHVHVSFLAG